MSDDLLTTIVFEVDANNVKTGITSIKRSISDLGKAVKEVAENTSAELDKITVKDGASSIEKATAKTSKAVIKQTGELQKAIATFGSTASTGLKSAYESIEKAQVRLSGIDPAILNPYINALKDVRALSGYVTDQQTKAAQEQEAATRRAIAEENHWAELKRQHAAHNKTIADQQAASLREELALVNSINEAALNRKYGGGAKPSAYYQEKAGTTASPDVANALANLRTQEQAQLALNRAAAAKAAIDDKAAKDLREQTAAFTAFRTEVQNAELNLVHFGRAKSAAMLADKGARLGFDPAAIQAELAALQKIEAANKAAFSAANPHLATLAKQAEAAGTSVKGLNANLRQVPAQFTDIIVSLQGGQNPLTVLLQQGGQLKDLFGGVGNAARALGSYIYGLINPYTIAAGVVTSLAVAYTQGAAESEAFNKALITTGNAAGVTSAQLANMAKSVSKTTGGTIGSAADSLAQLAGASGIASSQFESIAATAVMMEKVTGVAVADTVKQFAELGKDPVKASEDLNKSMHYLTGAVYEQIKALRDQGDAVGAAALAQKTYDDALKERIPQLAANLGLLEKAWKGIIGASKSAWDAMLNVGREDTLKSQIDKLQEKMASRKSSADYNPMAAAAQERVDKAQLEYMQRMLASQGAMAVYQKDSAKQEEAKIALSAQAEKSASKQVIMQRELNKAKEQYANIKNPTEKDTENYAAVVAKIAKDNTEAAKSVRAKKEAITDAAKGQKLYNDLLDTGAGLTANFAEQWGLLSAKFVKDNNMEELLKGQELLLAKQPAMLAVKKEQLDAEKELSKAIESANKERQKDIDTATKVAATLTDQIRAQQDHNASIGMTAEAIAQLTAQRELDKASALEGIAIKELDRNLDYQKYDATMAQVKAMRELAKEKATGGTLETAHKLADDLAKENKKAAEESSKYWEDALMRAFESGKGFFQSLWDTIKNTLKTQVLKVSLQAIGIGGAAGGAAAADVSNIFSTAGNASSIGSMFASAFPTAAATISTVGNAALAGIQSMIGMTGTAAQAATAAANGIAYATTGAASTAASAGSMIAAAGPYVAAAMGIYAIHQATQGETRSGGEYRSNITDGAKYAYGPGGGDSAASQVKLAIDTTTSAINATLKQVGSAATLVGFAAGYETSGRDRGGAYAGGTLSTGVRIGQDGSGDNYAGTKYDPTKGFNQDAKGAVGALDLELKQSIIETLQAAGDIPKAVTKVIDDALARANADSVAQLSAEVTDSTLAALNTVIGSVEVFSKIVTTLPFKDLADLSFDAAAGLIEFSGGIDNLASNLGGFYQNFYTESEQVALKTEFASKAFADLGQVMPAVDGSMRDWYRSLIDVQLGLDQSDPAIAKVTAGLLGMQGAVNELAPVVNVIKSAITGTTEALKNQAEWQQKLDIATSKTTQREIEKAAALAAADDATDTIINQLYALEDAAKAADDLKAMDAAIADTSATIRDFYAMLAAKAAELQQQLQGWADTYAPPDPAVLAARIAESVNTSGATENISAAELLAMTVTDLRAWAAEVSQLTVPTTVTSSVINADALRGAIASAVASTYAQDGAAFDEAMRNDTIANVLAGSITNALKKLGVSDATAASAGTSAANTMAAVRVSAAADWGATSGIDTLQEMAADWVKDALGNLGPIAISETVMESIFGSIQGDVDNLITQITARDNYVAPTESGASAIDTSVTDGLIKEAKSLNIELLKAQGNMSGAATAARDLATGGMDTLQKAMWDANELIRTQIAIQVERNSIKDEYYSVTDTDAQARKRQRDAIDPSNRIMFDLLQAAKDSKAARDTQKSLFGELATDGQKTQLATSQVNDAFKTLGLAVPKTTAAFLGIASGADASTEAGRNIINTLSGVADAFQLVANRNKLIEDLRDEAMQRYIDTTAKVLDAQKQYASALKSTISSMKDFLATLDGSSTATSVTAARANFTGLADKAAAGDTSVYDQLAPAAKSFLDLSKTYSRSLQEYRRDEAVVRASINGVIKVTEAQLAKLPSELALDTDPIREAWSALQIATNEQTNASVLLTAMSVDQGASRARLAAAEDTLAARYLDAISASPDFSKLKEKFDVAIVDLVNKNAMPDYSEVFKLPEDTLITLVTDQIDQAFPVVTGAEFDFESLLNSQIYNVLPDGMAGTEFDMAELLQDQITLILPPDFAGTETDLAKLLAAQIGVILPADFAGDMSDLAEMLNTRIGVILPDYFAGTETSLDGILKQQTGIVLFDGMAGDETSLDGILKNRAEDVLPDRFAGTSFDLSGRVQSRINVFMPTNFAGSAFSLNGLMTARMNEVMPTEFAGKPTDIATLLTTRINTNTLPEDFAGRDASDLAALLESRVENIMPDYFAGRDASDLADMLGERVADILPVNFAGSAFSAQAMMQTAINNAMNGLFTGTTTTNTGTTGTTPTTNSDYVNGVTQTWKLRTDDPRFYVGTSGVSWGVDYTMADVAQAMQRVSSPAQRDELRMFGRSRGYPGFAEGTSFVPYDMTANIHAGEEITPRPFVDQQRGARDKTNELLEEVIRSNRELKAELAAIKSNTGNTATSSSKTARTIEAVTLGGTEIRTKVIT